jgi:probable HAF family extracellular repeat protein
MLGARLILVASVCACAGPIYNLTDLGSLGGASAQAFGINSSGQSVGGATTQFGDLHAFTVADGVLYDLTTGSPASQGLAAAVNAAGAIAGTQFVGGQAYATVWTNAAAPAWIAGPGSYAMGINDAGQVAGLMTVGSEGHAFIASGGSVQDLGTFVAGGCTIAYGINADGVVTGYGSLGAAFRGFVWSPQTGYMLLTTLGGGSSYGMAINNDGAVAGNAQTATGYSHATVWQDGAAHDLGTLGGGSSYAYGINNSGDTVGYSWDAFGQTHAFLFEDGVLFDLNQLIGAGSGWTLTHAFAINDSGQIVGSGLLDGVEHAFRLDYAPGFVDVATEVSAVPEPSGFVLAGLGCAGLLWLRLRVSCRWACAPPSR